MRQTASRVKREARRLFIERKKNNRTARSIRYGNGLARELRGFSIADSIRDCERK